MVKLVFYGGVNEIGGNKILLEDKGTKIFLDFGQSFTFGEESIQAIKEYLEARKQGSKDSRNVEPEIIKKDSPLFKVWTKGEVKRYSRHSLSSLMREAFVSVNEERMSAHSLRKKLQTDLEKAGVNTNWIDQMLGHQLINSRDAYSLPTDEELKEAYTKAYQYIKIYPDITQPPKSKTSEEEKQLFKTTQLQATVTPTEPDIIEIEANNIQAIKQAL
jgi:histone acetyltransferase (RNA polymerase elongator complex component)